MFAVGPLPSDNVDSFCWKYPERRKGKESNANDQTHLIFYILSKIFFFVALTHISERNGMIHFFFLIYQGANVGSGEARQAAGRLQF